jgi:hypothetical protein
MQVTRSIVIAAAGHLCSQSAQRMQRSSSFRIAEFRLRSASSPKVPAITERSSSVMPSSDSGTSFKHSVGQTSTQPPQSTQRLPSNTGVTPQSKQRDASRIA